jgi:hypothetical protein
MKAEEWCLEFCIRAAVSLFLIENIYIDEYPLNIFCHFDLIDTERQ